MTKRLLGCFVALLLVASLGVASDKGKEGSWTGWITDTHCGAKGASAKHANCAKQCVEGGQGKWALYDPTDKKVYTLDAQENIAGHAGHRVKVTGSVSGDTIKVKSIETAPEPKEEPTKKGR